jgi:hypothetical protein
MWSQRDSNSSGRDQLPDGRGVALVQRSDNPDAGCPLSKPEPELMAWARSGFVNVISITFGSFTLRDYFIELFEVLTVVPRRPDTAFASP